MYRVFAIVAGGLMLAACASGSSSSSFLDSLKPAPPVDNLKLESEPAGAEARVPSGASCRTPCALDVPAGQATSVTFTLAGYKPETVPVEAVSSGGGFPQLSPNPVTAELEAAPPPAKKPVPRKRAAKKPAPKTSTNTTAPAAAAPPPASSNNSPWPAPAQQSR